MALDMEFRTNDIADQLRAYLERMCREMREHMAETTAGHPGLAERLQGYTDAMEDIEIMLADESHRVYKGITLFIQTAMRDGAKAAGASLR